MLTMEIKAAELASLKRALGSAADQLPKETARVMNKTRAKALTRINKLVRSEIAAPAADVKKTLRAGPRATATSLGTSVAVDKTKRLSLKSFKAKQTGRGVSYKISKKGGKKNVRDGFMGPKPGAVSIRLKGHAFKRTRRSRTPIVKLHGPSPWGVFLAAKLEKPTIKFIEDDLVFQTESRIKSILKNSGVS